MFIFINSLDHFNGGLNGIPQQTWTINYTDI